MPAVQLGYAAGRASASDTRRSFFEDGSLVHEHRRDRGDSSVGDDIVQDLTKPAVAHNAGLGPDQNRWIVNG